jgi:hypothetical protein
LRNEKTLTIKILNERSKEIKNRVSIGNYYRPISVILKLPTITDGKSVKKPTQTLRKNIGNYESFSNDEIKNKEYHRNKFGIIQEFLKKFIFQEKVTY